MDLSQKTDAIQQKLKDLNIPNVYFEPPQNTRLTYPCVVFKRGTNSSRSANNRIYKLDNSYDLTYICREPDDPMTNTILVGDSTHEPPFSMIRHIRHYVADGLHHDQYKLYFQ
jgi:hypothetical protein